MTHNSKRNGDRLHKKAPLRLQSEDPSFRLQLAKEMAKERYDDFLSKYNDPDEAAAAAARLERIIAEPVKIPEGIY